jgi:hypothetical protein
VGREGKAVDGAVGDWMEASTGKMHSLNVHGVATCSLLDTGIFHVGREDDLRNQNSEGHLQGERIRNHKPRHLNARVASN